MAVKSPSRWWKGSEQETKRMSARDFDLLLEPNFSKSHLDHAWQEQQEKKHWQDFQSLHHLHLCM